MADRSRSAKESIAARLAKMNGRAPVEEPSMLPLRLNMDDVPTVKSGASNANDRPGGSEAATHAEQDAMRECRLCKHSRLHQGETPRKLRRLPSEVTQHTLFKNKSAPIQLCPECDGHAVELALRNHEDRLTNV